MVLKSSHSYTNNANNNNIIFSLSGCLSLMTKVSTSLFLMSALLLSGCEQNTTEVLGLNSAELETPAINPIELEFDSIGNLKPNSEYNESSITLPISCRNDNIISAYNNKQSSIQVKGCGNVKAVLSDDTEGSRHQRFIVELDNTKPKHTVLIAHNIDLAPRVAGLTQGDDIVFYGEYEYNEQGGVVHWTHHDPAARHQHGWIEREGKRFQ